MRDPVTDARLDAHSFKTTALAAAAFVAVTVAAAAATAAPVTAAPATVAVLVGLATRRVVRRRENRHRHQTAEVTATTT